MKPLTAPKSLSKFIALLFCILYTSNPLAHGQDATSSHDVDSPGTVLIDAKGRIITSKYDGIRLGSDGTAMVESFVKGKGPEYGLVGVDGNVKTKNAYNEMRMLGAGRYAARQEKGLILLNDKGERIGSQYFTALGWQCEGLIPYELLNSDRWGVMDRNGKTVIEPQFEEIRGYAGGLAAVKKNGKWGAINRKGTLVIPCNFDGEFTFWEGLASVVYYGYGKGITYISGENYIDTNGKLILDKNVNIASSMLGGIASVTKGKLSGGMDGSGNFSIPLIYEDFWWSPKDGLATARKDRKTDQWLIIDRVNRVCGTFTADDAEWPSEQLIAFKRGGKWGYVDYRGEEVIAPKFETVFAFSEGVAAVSIIADGQERYGYILPDGSYKITPQYEKAGKFSNGVAVVKLVAEQKKEQPIP